MKFKDRRDAGQQLADRLSEYREEPGLLVIGLPRGGVPVALEIATALRGELDVMLVRKIGLPWHPELAAGAVASGGTQIFNEDVIEGSGVTDSQLQPVIDRELKELERREHLFRGDREPVDASGRHVIVVDDGLATGATMTAALKALQAMHPRRLTVAVPVASTDALKRIHFLVDETVCVHEPSNLQSVGEWYDNFTQVEDKEVQQLLAWEMKP
jgi:putative phosphoribosyl transferase